jgi:hypothetical protein
MLVRVSLPLRLLRRKIGTALGVTMEVSPGETKEMREGVRITKMGQLLCFFLSSIRARPTRSTDMCIPWQRNTCMAMAMHVVFRLHIRRVGLKGKQSWVTRL